MNNRRGKAAGPPFLFSLSPTGLSLFCLCLFLAQAPEADAKNDLRLMRTIDLPNLGIRIKLMAGSRETPLPPPSVFIYQTENGKADMYRAVELWFQSQHAGHWTDEHGISLTLATITVLLPPELKEGMLARDTYDKELAKLAQKPVEWTPDLLAQWVADFTGAKSAKAEPVSRKPSNLLNLATFSLEEEPCKLAYAFRLNRSSAGQSKAPASWFFVVFDVAAEADMEKARKAVLEDFFPSVTCAKAAATDEAGPSKTFQKKTGDKITRSPEFIASRDQVANSVKNMKDWWFVETENYIIISNLKSKYRAMVKDLQTYIECLRDAYSQLIPAPPENTAISVLRVFGTPDEYEEYVPPEIRWSSGVWLPDQKELVIRPIEWGGNSEQKENMLKTTAHEAFHQYLFYAFDYVPVSPWFNEGHADFFAGGGLKNNKLIIAEERSRAMTVDRMLGAKSLDLETILHMSYATFYSPSEDERARNYALAWAIVYYLRKEAEFDSSSPYKDILKKYAEALPQTKDPNRTTDLAFKGIDMEKFQRDFLKFWRSPNKRIAAARNRTKGEGRVNQ